MRSYFGLFKMHFKGELQYRAKAISGVLTQFFWGIMYIYLYSAFMGRGIAGFSAQQMVTYVWLGQAFFVLRYINVPKDVCTQIENGNICYNFVRPLNLYNQWYFSYIGSALSSTLLRFLPIILVAIILPPSMRIGLPVSFGAFMLFLLALIIGLLINGALSMFAVYLTFITLSTRGSSGIVNVIAGLLGGVYIPLPMLPAGLQNVLKFLPFSYISDLSFRIYIGNVDIKTALIQIAISLLWLVALVILGKLLIKSSLKKTVIQGG